LLEDGFIVFACDIQAELGKAVVAELSQFGEVVYQHLDVTDESHWKNIYSKVMETYGRLDLVVNNAGINIRVVIEECSVEQWDRMFQVNVRGPSSHKAWGFLSCAIRVSGNSSTCLPLPAW
jgi:NADP-dependent 3-hydroxy acid dehydrogenase YdfG